MDSARLSRRRHTPTCKGAAFDVQLVGHADLGAELQHQQHGKDHDYALPQERGLKVPSKPGGGREPTSGRKQMPGPAGTSTALPQPEPELHPGKESRGGSPAYHSPSTGCLLFQGPCGTGLEWGRAR